MSWNCNHCDMENINDSAKSCEWCGSPRPAGDCSISEKPSVEDTAVPEKDDNACSDLEWFIRCPFCGEEHPADNSETIILNCKSCSEDISEVMPSPRKKKGGTRSGASLYLREVRAVITNGICSQRDREPDYLTEPLAVHSGQVFGRNDLPQSNRYRYISEKHCQFSFEDGKWYIEDIGSMNYTHVDGRLIRKGEKKELTGAEKIQLADILLYPFLTKQ